MPKSIRHIEQQLKAIGNARRLAILAHLKKNKSTTAQEIAKAVRLSSPALSQHLRILKAAGIVEYKRRGMFVTYRLSLKQEDPIKNVISLL